MALWLLGFPASHVDMASASGQYSEDAVKAAFLYRFPNYVEWPPEALVTSRFTIAVLGSDRVAAELQQFLPDHSIANHPAQVRNIKGIGELGDAQILFVGSDYRGDLQSVFAATAARSILLVTDGINNGLAAGSTINFVVVDRRVRFEVSLIAANRSGLKIGSELLSVAVRVQGERLRNANAPAGHDP